MTAPRSRLSRRLRLLPVTLALALVHGASSGPAVLASQTTADHTKMQMPMAPAGFCNEAGLACATAATPYFDSHGTLWLAWAAGGQISVAHSSDLGHHFSAAVRVTPEPATLDNGPDARPQILVDHRGRVIVGYSIFKDENYNGQIVIAESRNGGATFTQPHPVTSNSASQRFLTLGLGPGDRVLALWIDKRHVVAATQAGRTFDGASIAFAWSNDGGGHFEPATIIQDHSCECCRLGLAMQGQDPVVLFRNIFAGSERDHAVITFTGPSAPGPLHRVSMDHWAIDACPHHGPSLAISPDGAYHAVWFTEGSARQGSFYARSTDGGATFSEPVTLGNPSRHPTRPYVLALGGQVWVAWKEFDGERTTVNVMASKDEGATWSAPHEIAATEDYSDHPLLVSDGQHAYVSWLTRAEGYHLTSLDAMP
jgi:hypothetical protein